MATPYIHANSREGDRAALVPPGQGGFNVAEGFGLALRNGTPLVERGIRCRGRYQAVNVAVVKRLETNAPATQDQTFRFHDCQYAMSRYTPATEPAGKKWGRVGLAPWVMFRLRIPSIYETEWMQRRVWKVFR